MKFMFILTAVGGAWESVSQAEREAFFQRHQEFRRELEARDKFRDSQRLHPPAEAKTLRLRPDGTRYVTDGPFAETRELMGGLYVIEAASMDEALEWSKKMPLANGSVEIRQIWEE
jgi:hypothetical protein